MSESTTTSTAAPGLGWPLAPDPAPHPATGLGWPVGPIDPQTVRPQTTDPSQEHA